MKHLFVSLILLTAINTFGQQNAELKIVLNKLVSHAESASLYRNKVNWDSVRFNTYELAKEAKTVLDLSPALKYLLESLGDEHGRVFHNNQVIANYYSGEVKDHQKSFDPNVYNQVQMRQTYTFHTEMLENKIGYVRIVGLPMGDNEKMASEIQSAVCSLIGDKAQNWIIDLRYNGGGNLNPMAEGLAPILGNGIVGGSKGLTEAENSVWRIENNHFYYDDYSIGVQDQCSLSNKPKIAVLTSLYTVSSGEALAVMFKGKEQTKFFGQKTLGLITVTDWEVIDDATAMTISVSYYADRNGNVYDEYVDVDQELPFAPQPLEDEDTCVQAAINWINGK